MGSPLLPWLLTSSIIYPPGALRVTQLYLQKQTKIFKNTYRVSTLTADFYYMYLNKLCLYNYSKDVYILGGTLYIHTYIVFIYNLCIYVVYIRTNIFCFRH